MQLKQLLTLLSLAFMLPFFSASGQNMDVTFRYVPQPSDSFFRMFAPGEFNNWGPNNSGVIQVGAASEMEYQPAIDEWFYTESLTIGQAYQYKFHFHNNAAGTDWVWISDPNNPVTDPQNNDNSIVTVSDPMVFELARKLDGNNEIFVVSAGIFGTEDISSITFEINGVAMDGLAHFDAATSVFRYVLSTPVPAGSQFKVTATDALSRTVADSIGIIPPTVVDEPLPVGARDGITYSDADPTEVTLSLLAPGKNFVHVIGDFNSWEVRPEYLMKRDSINADSVRWWLTLPAVTPNQEYAFQYLVDGQIRVADPYSEKILDPNSDQFIGDVYPNLKPYPTSTNQIVSVLQTNQAPYNWEATEYVRPAQHELVIYEMIVRDWVEDHSFESIKDSLDYLQNLGINAIELMPVAEFDGNQSWGYNPGFHLALDKYYGPADKLKELIDEAHKRDIAVILDVVYNHATGQSPLVRLYNQSESGTPGSTPTADNPWINVSARHPFNVFHDVNHESTLTKTWLDRANEHWLTEFNVDGFRFDLSKGFTQFNSGGDVGLWGQYDASRIAILTRMVDQIWTVDDSAYVILEHFGGGTEERELAEYRTTEGMPGMMLWNNMNHQYNEATMGYSSNLSGVHVSSRGWSVPNLISYMESHDEQWLMFKNISFGACSNAPSGGSTCDTNPGEYNVREFNVAFDRMKMAGAFFFTVPGPKMLWQFGELGYGYGPDGRECLRPGDGSLGDCPSGTPDRVDPKPIRWEYNSDPLRLKLRDTWAAMLRLRREHEVFRSSSTQVSLNTSGPGKSIQLDAPTGMDAVIVGNFSVASRSVDPNFHSTGFWYDFFTGDSLDVQDVNASMDLLAGEFHIYTSEKVFTPVDGLITVDIEDQNELPSTALSVAAIFPNPATTDLSFSVSTSTREALTLTVYDLTGRQVMADIISQPEIGNVSHSIDVSDLPSGLYFLRAVSPSGSSSATFIVTR